MSVLNSNVGIIRLTVMKVTIFEFHIHHVVSQKESMKLLLLLLLMIDNGVFLIDFPQY